MTPWLAIIGIGDDGVAGLSAAASALLASAELVVGGARHLAMVPPGNETRLAWETSLADTIARIADWRGHRVVVLASGDPMCYGVGVTLARHFERAEMTVLPQPGAFSLAAARLAWPLAECETLTLHGRPLAHLALHLAPDQRILLLSADGETPSRIAALLRDTGWGPSEVTVLEHLGGARENIVSATAESWDERHCADLNTVALVCRGGPRARPLSRAGGLPDEVFINDGQLTKREIRAATIAALAPLPGQLLWDVGAGCGAIAIEWLRAAPRSRAIAIERASERCAFIANNAIALGVPDLRVVTGEAPEALADLPRPDAVFLGGGLGATDLLETLWDALAPGGHLVANAVTVGGEAHLLGWQARHGGTLIRLAISRAAPIGPHLGWRPLMPVTQLTALKPGDAP
ncbi:MAG TPA: precorrin-6y C5,15-methyltransferase (decarboxylating) subunit CbiE [Stellaceae bacterium]|jgi:precorrin-6Y C5,15-methyltransferase (decarboxylating)|nr:precorrin-6y C5,15-methyltransferase (decarboxylating) subunit CbiE [Stellaceae bacterium]